MRARDLQHEVYRLLRVSGAAGHDRQVVCTSKARSRGAAASSAFGSRHRSSLRLRSRHDADDQCEPASIAPLAAGVDGAVLERQGGRPRQPCCEGQRHGHGDVATIAASTASPRTNARARVLATRIAFPPPTGEANEVECRGVRGVRREHRD